MPYGNLYEGVAVFPAVFDAIVDEDDHNELQNQLKAPHLPYCFFSLEDATEVAWLSRAIVTESYIPTLPRMGEAFSASQNKGSCKDVCTDGLHIYTLEESGGVGYVVAYTRKTGALVWAAPLTAATGVAKCLCCDGHNVYAYDDTNDFVSLNARTGAEVATYTTHGTNDPVAMACNGSYLIIATDGDEVEIWSTSGVGVCAWVATAAHGADILAVYCGDIWGVLAGVSDGVNNVVVRVFLLSDGSEVDNVQDDEWSSVCAQANSIYCDGRFIYVGTNDEEVTAGHHQNLVKLDVFAADDHKIVAYGYDLGAGCATSSRLCGDGRYLIHETSAAIELIDPVTMRVVQSMGIATKHAVCTDGMRAVGWDNGGAPDLIKGWSLGYHSRDYMNVGTIAQRYPVQGLLIVPL